MSSASNVPDAWKQANTIPRRVEDDAAIPGTGRRYVQVLYDPPFEHDGWSWELTKPEGGWRVFRSRVVIPGPPWHLHLLGYDELEAPQDELNGYFDRLRALSLPISPIYEGSQGRDGTVYQLALFGDLMSEVRFQWWSDPPSQWRPLVSIAEEMIARLQGLTPKNP